ncbi:hypothetical protein ACQEVF_17820 [Nonomuraea polychroma]|uniref:hypothetical protein n=1 Tax=Nonomuraea polychroma TaxID=46176 RepID=UPI003D8CBCDC
MSTPWAELDERAWQLYAGVHRLLLRLAGQVSDEVLTGARTMLAQGDLAYLPDTVTMAAAEHGVPLAAREVGVLRELLAAIGPGGEPAAVDQVTISDADPVPVHRFFPDSADPVRVPAGADLSAGDADDAVFDLTDQLVTDALSEHQGVVTVLRAWRSGPLRRRRVYLAEVEPGVPAWEVALEAQTELAAMGERDPQVEVYWRGEEPPPYQRAARDAAVVLWRAAT